MVKDAATKEVRVTLADFDIDMPDMLPAGRTTFTVDNRGERPHGLKIEGKGIITGLEDDLQPGEAGELTVDLYPGVYSAFCPFEDHEERGMFIDFRVIQPGT
jgi:uncharacterized cupredoxin-like copper-binding protein